MERAEYERLAEFDRRLWWFRGLHAAMLAALNRRGPAAGSRILDAGCGTGGLLAEVAERAPQWTAIGLDRDAMASAVARQASGRPVCVGSVNDLPFADSALGAILSADVLCHRAVDEAAALGQFHRCLKSGGVLVLNLPAYRWLLSDHDRAVHNIRRYTAGGVRRLLAAAGFTAIRTGYWNMVLFPLMALRRKLKARNPTRPESDVKPLPAPLEALFAAIVTCEAAVLGWGLRLPFGGSVLATAVKS